MQYLIMLHSEKGGEVKMKKINFNYDEENCRREELQRKDDCTEERLRILDAYDSDDNDILSLEESVNNPDLYKAWLFLTGYLKEFFE